MRKYGISFLMLFALAIASTIFVPTSSFAQRRGGGPGGGRAAPAMSGRFEGRGEAWRGGEGWRGDDFRRGFYGWGWGYPGFYGWGYPGYYSNNYYPGYNYSYVPSYPYSYPFEYYAPSSSAITVAPETSPITTAGYQSFYPPQTNAPVTVTVRVPDPNAAVWFDDTRTRQTGGTRVFQSPPLAPGKYSYEVRAQWTESGKEMDQTRTVEVRPGDNATVDFTTPSSPSGQ
jgi:uncharacterized protein (TIGR03000 family)